MAKHKYTYKGEADIHLPEHGINAKGGDEDTVYESDEPVNHPDFRAYNEQARAGNKVIAKEERKAERQP